MSCETSHRQRRACSFPSRRSKSRSSLTARCAFSETKRTSDTASAQCVDEAISGFSEDGAGGYVDAAVAHFWKVRLAG